MTIDQAREKNLLDRVFPERVIIIRSTAGSSEFRLAGMTQILLCLMVLFLSLWLSLSTAGAFARMAQSVPGGAGLETSRAGTEFYGKRADAAIQLLEQVQEENLQLKLALTETRQQILQPALSSAEGKVADDTGATASRQVEHLLGLLETALLELDAVRGEAENRQNQFAELVVENEIRDQRSRFAAIQLTDALNQAADRLESDFDRLDLEPRALAREIGSIVASTPVNSDEASVHKSGNTHLDLLTQSVQRMGSTCLVHRSLPIGHPVARRSRLTSGYGMRTHPIHGNRQFHHGLDFAAPTGTPIRATGDGVVISVGRQGDFGLTVKIRHIGGLETLYAHLSKIHVRKNQRVSRNQLIADMGSTGTSTGPHLHYEVRTDGRTVNPRDFIRAN
ncbi:MAG: M23 family metallopeptidase [Rhodobacteraceae bacterium]|nr:M23 family metallopeptidase [Paracoccaceae bacterium]